MRTRTKGGWVTQPERLAAIAPGTPMWKAVPPRLVGPYLTGQRSVLAGYVYRAQDVRFHNPAEAYLALSLGWADSEFTPHMSEIYLVAWLARAMDGYVPSGSHGVPEFYIEPIAIPAGAGMCRLGPDGDQLVARYDGLAWQRLEP
jgi:hypothetical protein